MLQVICIEGSGVSSSDNRPLTQAVKESLCNIRADFHTFTPFRFRAKCKTILDIYRRTEGPILIVAKSLGAYRLYKHIAELASLFDNDARRVAVVTVDPRCPLWRCGDGWKRPLDSWSIKPAGLVYRCNFFQLDRYPRGAAAADLPKDHNTRTHNTNHPAIVRHQLVRDGYLLAVKWLFR